MSACFTGRTDGQRSGRSAHPDQAGGFLVDDIQVRRPRHLLPVRLVVLQNLSLAERGDGTANVSHQVELAALEAEVHVFGQDVISDYDRIARLPAGIDRSPAPAHVRFVDHIVVDERGHVDHLDQRGCEQCAQTAAALPRRSVERRRQQHRHRTNPLAPRRERIIEHLGEQRAVRREFLPDELLEGLQITLDRLADHIECYHNRTFVYVEKRLAEYRAIVSPPEYNRPEPGINPCKGSDFSLSRGGNSMFFRTFGNRQKHSR